MNNIYKFQEPVIYEEHTIRKQELQAHSLHQIQEEYYISILLYLVFSICILFSI